MNNNNKIVFMYIKYSWNSKINKNKKATKTWEPFIRSIEKLRNTMNNTNHNTTTKIKVSWVFVLLNLIQVNFVHGIFFILIAYTKTFGWMAVVRPPTPFTLCYYLLKATITTPTIQSHWIYMFRFLPKKQEVKQQLRVLKKGNEF